MSELASKAREGKLMPADMGGGCFSISSLGGIGGTGFTPIINAPEVAMLERIRCGLVAMSNHNSLRAGTAVVITGPVLPWCRHLSVRCE